MKTIKLNDKLTYVKKVLETPYHFFYMTPEKQVGVIFENKAGKRFYFNNDRMYSAVETAEEYVNKEIEAGSLKLPESLKEEKKEG